MPYENSLLLQLSSFESVLVIWSDRGYKWKPGIMGSLKLYSVDTKQAIVCFSLSFCVLTDF